MRVARLVIAVGALLLLAGCSGGSGPARPADALVVGTISDPVVIDGALASDQESLRIVAQIFEGLTALAPGSTRVVPKLALRWRPSGNGKVWTFVLRRGVRFQDGTSFDAPAVCFNFNRWYGFARELQDPDVTYYWREIFGGFRTRPETSLYRACRAVGPQVVRVTLNRPFGALPAALALPSFTIASPRALRRYRADDGVVDANGNFVARGSYGIDHPTGTGPFRLESWTSGKEVVLVRNPSYWGQQARMPRLVFRQLDDPRERLDALRDGTVDIEDLYKQTAVDAVRGPGARVVWRPPFDVGYLGINQVFAPFRSPLVRRALAYGLDRAAVLRRSYGTDAAVSHEFTPPTLAGYAAAVRRYAYDPGRSRALLRKANLTPPVRVELWYPTGVWRPYLPDAPAVARGLAASLDRAGFRVLLRPLPWLPDYVRRVRGGGAELFLMGWIGDYADAGAFLESIFGDTLTPFGFRSPALQRMLARAQAEPDPARRAALYRRANREIMRLLPGVPLATTPQPVGVQQTVRGYVPSPLGIDSLAGVNRS